MSHWNYRVMRHKEDGEEFLEIHEVYYNNQGQITKWTVNPVRPTSGDITGFGWVLNRMKEATKKPVLDYDMQPEGEDDKPED